MITVRNRRDGWFGGKDIKEVCRNELSNKPVGAVLPS